MRILSKTMHVQESLDMDPGGGVRYRRKNGCTLSVTTILLLGAIFICSLVSVGFLVYNFAVCPNVPHSKTTTNLVVDSNDRINDSDNDDDDHHHHNDAINKNGPPGLLSKKNKDQQNKDYIDDANVRLPQAITPILYNITLIPFLIEGNFTFHGQVKIQVNVTEDCYNITLHAADLQITKEDVSVKLFNSVTHQKEVLDIKDFKYIEKKQFFIIFLNRLLKKGSQCEIFINYIGYLMDYLQGFYRSSYWKGNEKKWLAATQFQPTDARRAFPCFDEPAIKAKFIINIARPKNMSSISNMPQIANLHPEVDNLPSYVWDHYKESVPMSTYLVAFAVTDFSNQTNEFGNFTVWARSDAIHSAEYALQIGPKILKFFEEFFGIEFPLPKIDMIAVPDFQAGAMENWGLITYRETAMLYKEGVSAVINKQRVATVVAHELAHQWFGNLVTPSWWSDIWLNEGFASYVEYLGVDAIEPSWKLIDQFVVNEVQSVFLLDALSSSHKISVEVGNPDEINEIFDRISYAKGATIIRMMNHFLTSNVFRSGLKKYLKNLSYKSAKQDDLWRFLTTEAHSANLFDKSVSVKEIMDTWTLQTGFPVVNIYPDYRTKTLKLQQERFTYIPKDKNNDNPLWWIPITYTTSTESDFKNTRPAHWMQKQQTISIPDPRNNSTTDWLIANIQQTGYFRVNYDVNNWKLIISHLRDPKNFKKISPTNRAQLIDDALNLARAEQLDYNIALDITRYLSHEDEFVPWKAAITALNFIDSMLLKEGDYHLLKKYILNLLDMVYKKVGFYDLKDQRDLLTIYKRIDILTTACHLGHSDCVEKCYQNFQNWMFEPEPDVHNPISPNHKGLVYCTAIQHGSETEWDFAFERFIKTNVSSEKEILLSALGCSKESWILNRYLKRSFNDEHIRKQDVYRVFAAVSSNVIGQPIAFAYIRNHWKEIKAYLGSSLTNLNTIIKYSTRRMNNKFELEELKNFINKHHKDGGRTIQQTIEQIEVNIHWMNRNYEQIIDWLKHAVA